MKLSWLLVVVIVLVIAVVAQGVLAHISWLALPENYIPRVV